MALTDNLVSYWKLDESSGNAYDSVGSNTLTNTNVTYSAAKINNGAVFNGSDAKLQMTTSAGTFGGSTITISLWINYNSVTPGDLDFIIAKYNDGTDFGSWTVWYRTTGTKIQFGTNSDRTSNSMTYVDYVPTIDSNWHHYVFVNNGTNALIYVDGSQVASGSRENIDTASQPLTIGASNGGRYLQATIDEVGIWSSALSSTEVTSLYNSGAGLQYPFTATNTGNFLLFF